jgi:catechol 2,3-dioxygenase-like lactoylglutathione lyase family enzyme
MDVSRIRHVGFVVNNIEESMKFYNGVLGLKVYKRAIEEDDFISKLTEIKNVKLEWIKLIIPEGGLIELLQYHSHPDKLSVENPTNSVSNKIGCSHVALTVKDLDAIYAKLISKGYTSKSKPLIAPGGNAKILYCHDPDGSILELIEDLN